MSSGSHVDVSDVIFLPVTAFRIEPESKGSHLTVDGELIEHSAIQAEIFPSMANSRPRWLKSRFAIVRNRAARFVIPSVPRRSPRSEFLRFSYWPCKEFFSGFVIVRFVFLSRRRSPDIGQSENSG
ncbi:unnamed protein product [Nesidiocoris tenuis]|uniref:Uncharacterized protein n=1 Tax=Nesidiocoris tenuis TaxID=355587 RepID=A0A6H5H0X8_9HEMI|nr:unnamed protein product [Nesidiocoris tenuis]